MRDTKGLLIPCILFIAACSCANSAQVISRPQATSSLFQYGKTQVQEVAFSGLDDTEQNVDETAAAIYLSDLNPI
jgi:hypothetical protein